MYETKLIFFVIKHVAKHIFNSFIIYFMNYLVRINYYFSLNITIIRLFLHDQKQREFYPEFQVDKIYSNN